MLLTMICYIVVLFGGSICLFIFSSFLAAPSSSSFLVYL